jgi:hypothetical protein
MHKQDGHVPRANPVEKKKKMSPCSHLHIDYFLVVKELSPEKARRGRKKGMKRKLMRNRSHQNLGFVEKEEPNVVRRGCCV